MKEHKCFLQLSRIYDSRAILKLQNEWKRTAERGCISSKSLWGILKQLMSKLQIKPTGNMAMTK